MNGTNLKTACRPRGRLVFAIALCPLIMFPAFPVDLSPRTVRSAQDISSLDELERQLFGAVNRERASRGIPALNPNPALDELARRQSQDMARLGLLDHFSATAETLTERLWKADVYFVANAENVARSDSFDPEFIHESLMRSPEHRQSILNPAFDQAGMAIVRGSDGAFYATQEFIRIWNPLDEPEVRARVLGALDDAAREGGSAPLTPVDEIHRTARVFAREKGAGRELPAIPPEYGTTAVRFVTSGDLEGLLASVRSIAEERFRFVGVGSWFGRTPENPGGAYVVCVFLLSGTQAMDLSDTERRQAVLDALNGVRAEFGRRPLEIDAGPCRQAEVSNRLRLQRGPLGPPRGTYLATWFYNTPDLGRVPNVYGGGLVATKPYISGSHYLMKMSGYPPGEWQPLWDGLFWRFVSVHRDFFLSSPRLGVLARSFERMDAGKRRAHLTRAEAYLGTLKKG